MNSLFDFYSATQSSSNVQSSIQSQEIYKMEVDHVEDVADFMDSLYTKQQIG